jgi:hypothetical protein
MILNDSDIVAVSNAFKENRNNLNISVDDTNIPCISSKDYNYYVFRVGTTIDFFNLIYQGDKNKIDAALLSLINGNKEMFDVFNDIANFFKIYEHGNSHKFLKNGNIIIYKLKKIKK